MKFKKSFTLSELIIVLSIIGIIATLTIPGIIKKHYTDINKTKVKKAMATYSAVINEMTIDSK